MGIYAPLRWAKWRLTGYSALQYERVLTESEKWSRAELERYRDGKLHKLIEHCYANVPFYRAAMEEAGIRPDDIRHASDLVLLPVLTKDLVRRHQKDLLARNVQEMSASWAKTGGTTGEPMQICKNEECIVWSNLCYERGLKWGGLDPGGGRIRLFGGSLGLERRTLTSRLGMRLRGDLFLPAFELRADTAPGFFQQIRNSRCRFLLGYTSAIYRLAALAEEMNEPLSFEAVFPTAELLLPEWKSVIAKVFACEVLPYYGCGEVNSLGYCRPGVDGYAIPEEHVVVEVMRTDGATALSGEGRFLLTDLDNYAMPLVRYQNGDAGKISDAHNGSSPCGRIERLDGRYNSLLLTENGDLVSGAMGPHIFRNFASVESYRIVQEEPLKVVISIVPKPNFTEEERALIVALFSRHLGQRVRIVLQTVPSIEAPPSGKSVFVVNHCLSETAHAATPVV